MLLAGMLLTNSAVVLALPIAAHADSASAAYTAGSQMQLETIVVTGRRFNPEVAPSKASLDTMEPQTIISRSYIEDSVAPTADYVSILAIVPSLTGTDINGPGLSDGNVKNTFRGQPDGNFGMSYDGIPFGDTNGPTHHSESYFPASTIGGIDVERGPGYASTLGAATFGGNINLFSEGLTDDSHARGAATYGSWDTWNLIGNVQTGNFDTFGATSRLMVNLQETQSDGYLTLQDTQHANALVKYEADFAPNWTLTLFANGNDLRQHVNDNNGATPAQVTTFGRNFALQDTNPNLPTFKDYNFEHKYTDMEYARVRGAVTEDFHIDDQAYTYAYVNKTITTTTVAQTQADINADTAEGLGTTTGGTYSPAGSFVYGPYAIGGKMAGATKNPTDIPGYTKLNAYRVWGNILRASWDFSLGDITGQVRAGVWWEGQATERQRFYFDVTQCFAAAPCNIFDSEHTGAFADSKTKKGNILVGLPGTTGPIPGVGYVEHSGWSQTEPFLEADLRFDDLTVTPGIKFVDWAHTLFAPILSASKPPQPYLGPGSFTTDRVLPFAAVNYKIEPAWSVYVQYADGVYIPDISAFELPNPVVSFPKPQTTKNYQLGTVLYGDNFSFDADIYYIDSNNTINFITGTLATPDCPVGDSCATNIGTAVYRGVEGEFTYAFDDAQLGGALDGLSIFTNGSLNSAKSGGLQMQQAPFWTAAGGLIYKHDNYTLSLVDKATGQQYMDSTHVDVNGKLPGDPLYNGVPFYRLAAYNVLDFTGYYDLGEALGLDENVQIGGGVYNIFDSHNIVSMKINDAKPSGASVSDLANRPSSLDQYYFQAERSFQLTVKVRF